jgi:hypothetical protein
VHALDARRVAAPGREQLGHRDEALLARAGDLENRAVAGAGEVGERLGDRAGGDELRAHLRHVRDIALAAPVDELGDELVELRGAQDARRDRAGERRAPWGIFEAM